MKIYLVGGNQEFLENMQKTLGVSGLTDVGMIVVPKISPQELAEKALDCEILVASPSGFDRLSKEHVDGLPKLKFISTVSVGTDWVDLAAAKERGIVVSNEKGVNAESVAEHCFGLLLDIAKRITESDWGIREKGITNPSPYLGRELYGKTLGIIGTGDIGQRVARMATGFAMKVIGVNKSQQKVSGIELVDFETLLKESDIIVVTAPLTAETENLLSEKEFAMMKSGVIIVSTSREKIINKNAVVAAVQSGKVCGYGFDAEIMVPIEKDDPYLSSSRIVITPHTASMTEEADRGYSDMTIENINAFLRGKPVREVW